MSAPMAGLSDALRAVLPRRRFGNVLTTLRPSSVELRVDGPAHRWSAPPSSAPLPAIAWQLGRLRLVLLACASGLIAYTPSGVNTGCAEPWHLLPGVCHMYLSYVLLIMRGCIVEYFIAHFARKAGKSFRRINKKTLDLLQSYPWPGNIRELQNVVERSVIVCETENFSVDESWLSRHPLSTEPKGTLKLSHTLAAREKETIEAALRESRGQVSGPSGAAAKLGIHRSTLESKIASLKIT